MGTRVGFLCLLVVVATLASCASARKNRHHKSNQKNKDEDYLQPRNKRGYGYEIPSTPKHDSYQPPAKPYVDPEEYVIPDPHDKPDPYAETDRYAKPVSYVKPDPYANPDPHVKPEPYAKQEPYSKPDPYAKPDPYGKPDPYAKSLKSHFMPHHPSPAIPALHGAGPSYYTAYKPKSFHSPGYPAYHLLPHAPGWSKPPAYQPYVTNPLSVMPSPVGFKPSIPLMPTSGWYKPALPPLHARPGWSSPGYVAPSLSSYSPALNYKTVFNSPSYPARRYRPLGQSGSHPTAPAPASYALPYKSYNLPPPKKYRPRPPPKVAPKAPYAPDKSHNPPPPKTYRPQPPPPPKVAPKAPYASYKYLSIPPPQPPRPRPRPLFLG